MDQEISFTELKDIVQEMYAEGQIEDYTFKTGGSTEDHEAILELTNGKRVSASVQAGEGFLYTEIDPENGEPLDIRGALTRLEFETGIAEISSSK